MWRGREIILLYNVSTCQYVEDTSLGKTRAAVECTSNGECFSVGQICGRPTKFDISTLDVK